MQRLGLIVHQAHSHAVILPCPVEGKEESSSARTKVCLAIHSLLRLEGSRKHMYHACMQLHCTSISAVTDRHIEGMRRRRAQSGQTGTPPAAEAATIPQHHAPLNGFFLLILIFYSASRSPVRPIMRGSVTGNCASSPVPFMEMNNGSTAAPRNSPYQNRLPQIFALLRSKNRLCSLHPTLFFFNHFFDIFSTRCLISIGGMGGWNVSQIAASHQSARREQLRCLRLFYPA